MDRGLKLWPEATVWSKKKYILNMHLSTLQDGLELCGLLLLLFWRHPFTAEDLLVQVM